MQEAGMSAILSPSLWRALVRRIDYVLVLQELLLISFLVALNWYFWQYVIAPMMGWPLVPWHVVAAFTLGAVTFLMIAFALKAMFRFA
jgi:hypothetical protein